MNKTNVEITKIRVAVPNDAKGIATIHINSWKETYINLIPQNYLDSLKYEKSFELWKTVIPKGDQTTLVAEAKDGNIVGFINGSAGRDNEYSNCAEISSLYLLKRYQNQKIGFNLLKTCFDKLSKLGYKKGYLWVLKDNPTIIFYEKTGGKFNQRIKKVNIGNKVVTELCYVSENIEL